MQLKDADGRERGGIASEEDDSFMFGIDDQRGMSALTFIPFRTVGRHLDDLLSVGSGVYLQGGKGRDTFSLLNPAASGKRPALEIMDPSGSAVD